MALEEKENARGLERNFRVPLVFANQRVLGIYREDGKNATSETVLATVLLAGKEGMNWIACCPQVKVVKP